MKREEVQKAYEKLRRALETLKEGLLEAETPLEVDGVLQRFEYTFESFWKFLKILLEYHGFECKSPRSCIKTAFTAGFLEDDELFLDMLEDRNLTSHIYGETESREVFDRIRRKYMEKLERFLEGITDAF